MQIGLISLKQENLNAQTPLKQPYDKNNKRLMLQPSGPHMVHILFFHKTLISTFSQINSFAFAQTSCNRSTLRIVDFRCKEPLTPRLAQQNYYMLNKKKIQVIFSFNF